MSAGGSAPCILNAANEVAVQAFLQKRIGFASIPRLIATTMEKMHTHKVSQILATLEDVLDLDQESRLIAASLLPYQSAGQERASA
jgi:1-deoxy-D-xylulose-5-phosphate reductoisomerase